MLSRIIQVFIDGIFHFVGELEALDKNNTSMQTEIVDDIIFVGELEYALHIRFVMRQFY